MNANELRLGNWVLDSEGRQPTQVMPSDFSITICTYLEPIPLTEEWLEKFGYINEYGEFRKSMPNPFDRYYSRTKFTSLIQFEDDSDFGAMIIEEKSLKYKEDSNSSFAPVKIQYVHQLQNLYFALTGEELTIKE